ncbi:MAG: hypothetical protein ACXAC8_04065 [Candidatus Hodarchaeales archaeon]|jgi:predicted  nucleic acid-binding Zn-ribbon protein
MVDNSFNPEIDLQRENYASIEAIKDSIKTILSYMRNLNNAIEKLDLEIEYVKNRVKYIEKELGSPSFSLSQSESITPLGLPLPPEIPKRTSKPTRTSVRANLKAKLPKVDESQSNFQSELNPSLTGDIKAREDDFLKRRTAVHQEFKKINLHPNVQKPDDETQMVSELKEQLSKDLDDAFKIINRKFKNKF